MISSFKFILKIFNNPTPQKILSLDEKQVMVKHYAKKTYGGLDV
jgi:hypothetical protein